MYFNEFIEFNIMFIFIIAIVLAITSYIYYKYREISNERDKDITQHSKKENSKSIIRWFYSERHPEQKYYKNFYRKCMNEHKKLEIDRIKKDKMKK
ncbi:hypothetical protein [Anaerovorax sp. IOR16]|uniref:hypothetical protein n=1 Tax=Anaerovorax sp. IOR16 TaxID=2773458 RepID=UPI0019D2E89A|nr:hypothetical protein [Anaerovorax sp. IOR16]